MIKLSTATPFIISGLVVVVTALLLNYLKESKRVELAEFIKEHDCKAHEAIKIDNFETNIIYRCNDGEEIKGKL